MSEASAKGVHLEIQDLKDGLGKLEIALNAKIGDLETEVRVVKHDFANLKEMINGVGSRVDKMEERLTKAVGDLAKDVVSSNAALVEKIGSVNIQQAKGVGFFAGIGAVITVAGALLLALIKVFFGHQAL